MTDIKIKRYADKENLKELVKYCKDTFVSKDGSTPGGTPSGDYYTKSEIDTKLDSKANTGDLSTVATTGSYNDLLDKPTSFDVDLSNYYTKSEVDNLLSNISVYSITNEEIEGICVL